MIKTFLAMMVFASTCVSGCGCAALLRHGENVSYLFWNNSDGDIENVVVVGIFEDKSTKYYASVSEAVRRYARSGKPIHGFVWGHRITADTGYKVPKELGVSWHKLPSAGGKPYTPEVMGPYRVAVRSRIPEEALRLARSDAYNLGINLAVGNELVRLCWVVATYESDYRGRTTLMAGGQCNPEEIAWRDGIDWRKPGVWFPEKQ